ncbi:MAG TPA: hypothetical protein VGV35_16620 [Bryobacteraceae bacterium]|nr:hypothetical protein [Bryobacteraceae bacterium]
MKAEYDFRKGTRGKFYRPNSNIQVPVYLEPEVLAFLSEKADKKGVSLDEVVNELLKRDIGIIETVG